MKFPRYTKSKSGSDKIFCVGRNKTGTTSLSKALSDFGISVGNQRQGEMLLPQYATANWKPIIRYCKTASAFQDIPFSFPYTWMILAEHFPSSKFILTIRDSLVWYNSLIRFHTKLFSSNGEIPNQVDLEKATYRYKGFMWEANRAEWKTPEKDPYNMESLIANYNRHNNDIIHFFAGSDRLLTIDVSKTGSYLELCSFLKKEPLYDSFPHLNRTDDTTS